MSEGHCRDGLDTVYREAALLDRQRFADWLELYTEDSVYWVPAWRDDNTQTSDPKAELSLIYYVGRDNLRDRIERIVSGSSPASRPLPRVAHIVSSPIIESLRPSEVTIHSSFIAHVYYPRTNKTGAHFGQYEHVLRRDRNEWRIARKIVRLANDVVATVLDINAI